jgi:multidrug efflux pump subunit AcrB
MAHKSDAELIEHTHNTSRFFVEHPQVAWALLTGTLLWGSWGYRSMPERKDPEIPVRVAVASCPWPGATAQQVEQLITRPIERSIAENKSIHPPVGGEYGIRSISLPGYAFVYVQLAENVKDTKNQFNDIHVKLRALSQNLPHGAGPVNFQSDFGDTAALMLTVASPLADRAEIALRSQRIAQALTRARALHPEWLNQPQVAVVYSFPESISTRIAIAAAQGFVDSAQKTGLVSQPVLLDGPGFLAMNAVSKSSDSEIAEFIQRFFRERLRESEIHPDAWQPIIVRDLSEIPAKLQAVAGDKYSYAELDDFTDLVERTLLGTPQASKVERNGVLPEVVYLAYSQDRLASYGFRPSDLSNILSARNITAPAGSFEAGRSNVILNPSGLFPDEKVIGDVIIGTSTNGEAVYLRDLVDVSRGYQSPAQYLNYYTWRDPSSGWHRSRAVTLAVYMRSGEQITQFGSAVDAKLRELKQLLPSDLIIAHTSDQPLQVKENMHLFMSALYEAVLLVILVALAGFWEWRSALLMALAIPITLAMTFGVVYMLGVDLQQVSIATLIIALGLLVDDPVVAGDAIKREIALGHPRNVAAWLGPTKLSRAILFATATNIIAYLPFMLLTGNTGEFLFTLPVVMSASLVCSRLVSMTFIPALGYYLLRPHKKREPTLDEKRTRGFYGFYYRLAGQAIRFRWLVFVGSLGFIALGVIVALHLKSSFFPDDVQYWSYVDIWLS